VNLELPGKSKPYLMAHRGNAVACPENTLAAFQHAISDGVDIIETDLHFTSDNVLVCIHDATVDRTTDGKGAVANLSLNTLKTLHANYGRPAFKNERVPTLEELLEEISGQCALALELKTDKFLKPEACEQLVKTLENGGMRKNVVIISFELKRVQAVQAVAPDIPIGFITMEKATPQVGVQFLGPAWPLLKENPDYVVQAHQEEQLVCPLDEMPNPRLALYQQLGCDVIMSNDPGETAQAMSNLGIR